jgi:hypothetical protein
MFFYGRRLPDFSLNAERPIIENSESNFNEIPAGHQRRGSPFCRLASPLPGFSAERCATTSIDDIDCVN